MRRALDADGPDVELLDGTLPCGGGERVLVAAMSSEADGRLGAGVYS